MKYKMLLAAVLAVLLSCGTANLSAAAEEVDDTSILKGLGTFFTTFNLGFLANQRYELETGFISTGKNDIRVPGEGGDMVSFKDDLKEDIGIHFRFRLTQPLAEKHRLVFTYAPMKISSSGKFSPAAAGEFFTFAGMEIPSDLASTLEFDGEYRLDSYRQAYIFDVANISGIGVSFGVAAEIRDEAVTLKSGDYFGKRADNNVVALASVGLNRIHNAKTSFLAEADILIDAQNPSLDLYLGSTRLIKESSRFKVGYRLVQRSTDSSSFYNKAMFHMLTIGLDIDL
jgi:hypothetical protein